GAGAARARAQAEDDHGRRQRVSARDRLPAHRQGRRRRRLADGRRHGPHRRARRRRRAPEPRTARRLRHHDDAQDAARPAGGHDPVPGAVRQGPRPRDVPRRPGRTADAHHRGQGGLPQGSDGAVVCRLPAPDCGQRGTPRRLAERPRLPPRQRRHRQSPDARRRLLQGPHRQGRGGGARQGGHHREQERDPVRPEPADGRQRHPRRHAGRDDARHARTGDGSDRRSHCARARRPGRRTCPWHGQGRSGTTVPEVPAVSRAAIAPRAGELANLRTTVEQAFAPDGGVARAVPDYEPRAGQVAMAAAVADVIEHGGTLIAEAGTGTGKTLAYLAPAILSGQRVLVSTGTKNLQEQIFFKDLPTLRQALGRPFTATLMKGRSNYLCLHRFETYRDGVEGNTSAASRLIESGDRVMLPIINAWAKKTETGDRAELRDLPDDLPLWKDIAADAETCLGSECPRYGDCFVTLMRQRAAESDVVIVNHHLLCADAQLRKSAYGEVIPACATLVVDEAHQLEDVATQYFGIAVSNYRVDDLMREVERTVSLTPEMLQATSRVTDRARTFFSSVASAQMNVAESKARYNSDTFVDYFQEGAMLAGALEGVEATLVLSLKKDEPDEVVASLARRARELREDLTFLIRASDTDFVYYVESRGRGLFLRAS